jgi:hypothetical protein
LRRISSDRDVRIFWILVVAIPFFLAILDSAGRIARQLGYLGDAGAMALMVSEDYSIAELVGYLEMLASAALIWIASNTLRDARLKVMAGIVAFLLCDDVFMLHDRARVIIGELLFSGHKQMVDFGELVYFSVAIATIIVLVFLTYRKAQPIHFYRLLTILGGFATFALFAVIIDQIGSFLENLGIISARSHRSIGTIEDSGELLGIGLIFMASLILYRMGKVPPPDTSLED